MASDRGKHKRSAILILEESIHFLRTAPASVFLCYYAGTLPFVLGLLYFWADMSRSPFAADHLSVASLGIALLFCWMKLWHTIFAHRIQAALSATPRQAWSIRRLVSTGGMMTLIHSTGIIILPVAALLMLPFGWCYAFYQNVSVQVHSDSESLRTLCSKAWRHAKMWPWQNIIAISVFTLFGLMVYVNLAIMTFVIPYLLKKFAGIESVYTMSGFHAFNTTFLTTVLGLTYLCMDPIIKTAYALRCFYGEAVKSGADLKTGLNSFSSGVKGLAACLILLFLLSPVQSPAAETIDISPTELSALSPEQLDRSIDEVLQRREYTWRLPREPRDENEQKQTGILAEVLKWLSKQLKGAVDTLDQWMKKLEAFLNKLFPASEPGESHSATDWRKTIRYVVFAALIIFVGILLYYLAKGWRQRRKPVAEIESQPVLNQPDLNDEDIRADDFPVNHWLQLARELMAKGSLRLAMRALYLASLAYLAERDLIIIEMYKSNRDYERELFRRAHDKKNLINAFSETVLTFDRVWYGMHKIVRGDVDQYLLDQERIMLLAD
jgi:hypothetical protein